MRIIKSLVLGMLCMQLAGCVPLARSWNMAALPSLVLEKNMITIRATPPHGWKAYVDGQHLILSNQSGHSPLRGATINIWLPDNNVLQMDAAQSSTRTAEVLQQITHSPSLIGDALASIPQSFVWQHFDGAYYLLNAGTSTATLVVALTPPDTDQMIVMNITTPADHLDSVAQQVGVALDQVQINDHVLGAGLLDHLPHPLVLPEVNQPDSPASVQGLKQPHPSLILPENP